MLQGRRTRRAVMHQLRDDGLIPATIGKAKVELAEDGDVFVHYTGSAYPLHLRGYAGRAVAQIGGAR